MKGIILTGGLGTRLRPATLITNKQLLPVYNKPMILYPMDTLKKSGVLEVMIVCGRDHAGQFMDFLGSGKEYGLKLSYAIQDSPKGIADAIACAQDFSDGGKIAVTFGDNIFQDHFAKDVSDFSIEKVSGAKIFLKTVPDPWRFGVANIKGNKVISIEEKPKKPKSNYVVAGFYLFDKSVFEKIKQLKPSQRGELEITDLHNMYIKEGGLFYSKVKGFWSDVGTFESLLKTANWAAKRSK